MKWFSICIALLFASIESAVAQPGPFFFYSRGDLPLLLEAPHDGTMDLPPMLARPEGAGGRDTNVSVVIQKMVLRIKARTGKWPYVLVMRVKRDFIEANTEERHLAYTAVETKAIYDNYYKTVSSATHDIADRFGAGFMFSVHCGGNMGHADVYFGTNGGGTIQPFRKKYGDTAFDGPDGLPARLALRGYLVPGQNGVLLHGGWTGPIVARYTQAEPSGLDGAQIEIERIKFMHDPAKLNQISIALADSLLEFLEKWYDNEPKTASKPKRGAKRTKGRDSQAKETVQTPANSKHLPKE